MQTEKIKQDINQLDISEKILLVEDIWDSIASSNAELPMPEWQKKELNSRYKEYKKGDLELHDSQSIYDDLREKYK
jgi:putative addiction module component (TIGR02574 family)